MSAAQVVSVDMRFLDEDRWFVPVHPGEPEGRLVLFELQSRPGQECCAAFSSRELLEAAQQQPVFKGTLCIQITRPDILWEAARRLGILVVLDPREVDGELRYKLIERGAQVQGLPS